MYKERVPLLRCPRHTPLLPTFPLLSLPHTGNRLTEARLAFPPPNFHVPSHSIWLIEPPLHLHAAISEIARIKRLGDGGGNVDGHAVAAHTSIDDGGGGGLAFVADGDSLAAEAVGVGVAGGFGVHEAVGEGDDVVGVGAGGAAGAEPGAVVGHVAFVGGAAGATAAGGGGGDGRSGGGGGG